MPKPGTTAQSVLILLGRWPGWKEAIERLTDLYRRHGDQAAVEASHYSTVYRGRRAAMVFDVVASRQRRYIQRVRPWVEAFQQTPAAASLSSLAEFGPALTFSLRDGEADTMRTVASGLLRFGIDSELGDDDAIVEAWAASVAPLEVAPRLDPYVGAVKGIGIALFCYMRMRAGADAIKPDARVRQALQGLGFDLPAGEATLLVVASTLAQEVGISRLILDQLLWWAGNALPGGRPDAVTADHRQREASKKLLFQGKVVDIRPLGNAP
jgi:hypothetical protein